MDYIELSDYIESSNYIKLVKKLKKHYSAVEQQGKCGAEFYDGAQTAQWRKVCVLVKKVKEVEEREG